MSEVEYTKENPLVIPEGKVFEGKEREEINSLLKDGRAVFGKGEPPAGGENPPAGGENPPAGDNPPAGGDEPNVITLSSEDEINAFFQKTIGHSREEVLQSQVRLQELQSRNQELEGLYTETVNPFADESVAKLNTLVKEGVPVTMATRLLSTDVKELSAEDALVIQLQKNGVGLSDQDLLSAVREKYGYEEDEEGNATYKSGNLMKLDAASAKKELASLVEKATPSDNSALAEKIKTERADKFQKAEQAWGPHLNLLSNSGTKASLSYGDNKAFDVDIPKEYVAGKMDVIKKHLISNGLQPDKNGLDSAKAMIENMYFLENRKAILTSFEAQKRKEWDAGVHNGGAIQRDQGGKGEKTESNHDRIKAALRQHQGS